MLEQGLLCVGVACDESGFGHLVSQGYLFEGPAAVKHLVVSCQHLAPSAR